MIPEFQRITAGRLGGVGAWGGPVKNPTNDLVGPKSRASSFKAAPWKSKRPQIAGFGWAPGGPPRGRAARFWDHAAADTPRGCRYSRDAPVSRSGQPLRRSRSPAWHWRASPRSPGDRFSPDPPTKKGPEGNPGCRWTVHFWGRA